MTLKPPLSLVAHGTDGSDGLAAGIHLRWSFDPRLGFPPGGFKLYRRESDPARRRFFDFNRLPLKTLPSPAVVRDDRDEVKLKIKGRAAVEKVGAERAIRFKGGFELALPETVSRLTLRCRALSSPLEVAVVSGGDIVGRRLIQPKAAGDEIVIGAPSIDALSFDGSGALLFSVEYRLCADKGADAWQGPINAGCGLGLPNAAVTEEAKELDRKISDKNPAWAVASCRLRGFPGALQGQAFQDFMDFLDAIAPEGADVPVGWTRRRVKSDAADGQEPVWIAYSPYDMLLLRSVDPPVAAALGLSYHDASARPGRSYDYKVEAEWPAAPGRLAKLSKRVDFESAEIGAAVPAYHFRSGVLFGPPGRGAVVASSSDLDQSVTRGLRRTNLPNGAPLQIAFEPPVREAQVLLSHGGAEAVLEGVLADGTVVSTSRSGLKNCLLAASGPGLRVLRIAGQDAVIQAVLYDERELVSGLTASVLCGVSAGVPAPMEKPGRARAARVPGAASLSPDAALADRRLFGVDLTWDLPKDSGLGLAPGAPVAYHVRRDGPGGSVRLTEGEPLFVSRDPSGRRFFDQVAPGRYSYAVRAVDVFGRESADSAPAAADVAAPAPIPPSGVRAKFADAADPAADEADLSLLADRTRPAVVVRWSWPAEARAAAPDAAKFRIRLEPGWLNLLRGTPTSVRAAGARFSIRAKLSRRVDGDALAGELLRQGERSFRIVRNTAGTTCSLTVEPAYSGSGWTPEEKPFVLALTRLVVDGGAAADYRLPGSWTGAPMEVAVAAGQDEYAAVLPASAFPSPAFVSDEKEKLRYAQVGVSVLGPSGEGAVSLPATVVAVCRTPPPVPSLGGASGLLASPADAFGKSKFALEWPAPAAGSKLSYFVYRALEESLIAVSDPARADNERCFSRLNGTALSADDPAVRFGSVCRYVDASLDGRGRGRYYYRLRSVDEAGNLSDFGAPTAAVSIPPTEPAAPPALTRAVGGDLKVTLTWRADPASRFSKFQLYRADDAEAAKDLRRMTLVGDLGAARVAVSSFEFSWDDVGLEPKRTYYYRLAGVDDDGLKTAGSPPLGAVAVDRSPPPAPVWVSLTRSAGRAHLLWTCARPVECLVKREVAPEVRFAASSWLRPTSFDESRGLWVYEWEQAVPADQAPRYILFSRGAGGLAEGAGRDTPA